MVNTIKAFVSLGDILQKFTRNQNNPYTKLLEEAIKQTEINNPWFTKPNILFALQNWANLLTTNNLENWLTPYCSPKKTNKTIALIMAGNIPIVGFHDFLCVLLSGYKVLVKLSSKDNVLLKSLTEILILEQPELKKCIAFEPNILKDYDAVIATGSDNSARYFEHYFGKYPNIIRKNRTSIAILTGRENEKDLELLGKDLFTYFGLGCRNISKLLVPKAYDFEPFWKAIYTFHSVKNHHKFVNNYDYYRSIFLMNQIPFRENGFFMLKEDENLSAPIAVLNYQCYQSITEVEHFLDTNSNQLQCVVALPNVIKGKAITFGSTQQPELSDYADDIDTMAFLSNL